MRTDIKILGMPVVLVDDMPLNKVILFGDFSNYVIWKFKYKEEEPEQLELFDA
jgi:HK97 family phage major capsid protein